jgi:isopentenyl-diphosphate delta-isomerase
MPVHADNPDEYFDTYTEQGEKLEPMRRAHVHASGIWHKAVNVMLYRSNGALVLQQRAAAKTVSPLAWDLSVAEHLKVNESWQAAAHRGLAEELGLTNVALTQCGPEISERHDQNNPEIHNYEFQRCFRGTSDAPLKIDAAEVLDVREIALAQFKREALDAPQRFTPWLLTWSRLLGIL